MRVGHVRRTVRAGNCASKERLRSGRAAAWLAVALTVSAATVFSPTAPPTDRAPSDGGTESVGTVNLPPSSKISADAEVEIDPLQFVNAEMKNGTDLARWAESALENRWGYVLGTFGRVLDEALLAAKAVQYPGAVQPSESFIRAHWVGGRAADCVGLIKGYVWYNADTGTIDYGAHGLPDVDAGGMYDLAAVKGSINTMPELPGLAVYIEGRHIGIYVGSGDVIHAMDTEHGVVRSKLAEGSWTHWLQVPGVEYGDLWTA